MPSSGLAHGGGLNRYGCHNERATGGYHCHRSSYKPTPRLRPSAPAARAKLRTITPASRGRSASRTGKARASSQPKDLVLAAEALLRANGLNPGTVDGRVDSSTVTAIREFEANNGLPISGKFRPELLAPLARAAASKRR